MTTGFAAQDDIEAGRNLLKGGSRSFHAASFLLPRQIRDPATALYAFCRLADDAIDLAGHPREATQVLRGRLGRIYAGKPLPLPADRALTAVVHRFGIPRALLDALIEGFAWDAEGRRYPDISALYDYCARVAGTVGAMMALLMGARDPDRLARACDLGVAMQLSNIARDVGEDAATGRIYLPLSWMQEAGIDPDRWLADPSFSPALGQVVERVLGAADALYARADIGIAALPRACRPGIAAARRLYAEIGQEVRRRGLDSVSQRAVVSSARKLGLLGPILAKVLYSSPPQPIPPLPETRFLVEAAVSVAPARVTSVPVHRRLTHRLIWVLELIERLERRDRARHAEALGLSAAASPAWPGQAC